MTYPYEPDRISPTRIGVAVPCGTAMQAGGEAAGPAPVAEPAPGTAPAAAGHGRGRDAEAAGAEAAGAADREVSCRSARPARRTSAAAFFGEPVAPDDPLLGFAPYEHAAPRRNSITPERQRAFIAALAATGIVTQAARSVGASLEALYKLRHRKGAEGFSAAWDMAIDRGMMRLEDCALERAIQGETRPVASQGRVVATYVRYDTALMLFLLRSRRARRYGAGDAQDARPGSALYERVRDAVLREQEAALPDVRDAIERKLEGLRREVAARKAREVAGEDAAGGD